jgi:hypothetical protein
LNHIIGLPADILLGAPPRPLLGPDGAAPPEVLDWLKGLQRAAAEVE